MPVQPVILGAWARAVSERGEDGGTTSGMLLQEALESIKHAIITDSGNVAYENDWFAV